MLEALKSSNAIQFESISSFLQKMKGDGSLSIIGGHYSWPSKPTRHSILSIKASLSIAENTKADEVTVFLDDIGASNACAGNNCGISKTSQTRSLFIDGFEAWVERNIESLKNAAERHLEISPKIISELIFLLEKSMLSGESHALVTKLHNIIKVTDFSSVTKRVDFWLNIESLIYLICRSSFYPFALSFESKQQLKGVLLERSMSNKASKNIHKLAKNTNPTELVVIPNSNNQIQYFVSGYAFNTLIELRQEKIFGNGEMIASNKCAALVSQLLFKIARSKKISNKESITIFYLIPCYDQSRIFDGMWAFIKLYAPNMLQWFGTRKINLVYGYFLSEDSFNVQHFSVISDCAGSWELISEDNKLV